MKWDDLTFGKWDQERMEDFWIDVPDSVRNNGTWWADMFLVNKAEVKDEGEGHELEGGPMKVMLARKRSYIYISLKLLLIVRR